MSYWKVVIGVVSVAIVGMVVYNRYGVDRSLHPIASRGGTPMKRFVLSSDPIYLQTDPRWGNDRLGGSSESFSSTGCTVCSVSMALAEFNLHLTPGELNALLKKREGFVHNGWLRWDAIRTISNGRLEILMPRNPEFRIIDDALRAGNPVVAKVLLNREVPHWVLIVGKEGYEYLVKDPLGDGKDIETLSQSYPNGIQSIRIVTPARN